MIPSPITRSGLPLVELRDATVPVNGRRFFPRTAWVIYPGEHWAIVGPNGSGKSALAKELSGDMPVVDGEVRHPSAGIE